MTASPAVAAPQASSAAAGDMFGQPKGLWVLAGTELWDRIPAAAMAAGRSCCR